LNDPHPLIAHRRSALCGASLLRNRHARALRGWHLGLQGAWVNRLGQEGQALEQVGSTHVWGRRSVLTGPGAGGDERGLSSEHVQRQQGPALRGCSAPPQRKRTTTATVEPSRGARQARPPASSISDVRRLAAQPAISHLLQQAAGLRPPEVIGHDQGAEYSNYSQII
jgi:hypothetical protein